MEIFENKKRNVLPNWRNYTNTILSNELNSFLIINDENNSLSIEAYIESFKHNKSIAFAGELLSAAFVNNYKENKYVKDAANYILNNKDKSTPILVDLAEILIGKETNNNQGISIIITDKDRLKKQISTSINKIK
ncbi:MAG: hypothetical protein WCT77_07050, partial [Bacteroidota bacterium]